MSRIERKDTLANPTTETPISELIEQRLSRRNLLKGAAAMGAVGLAGGGLAGCVGMPKDQTIGFTEIKHALIEGHEVAPGYSTQMIIRWGDAMFPDSPAWNPRAQTAAAQIRQYGTDNDFLAFMPLPYGSKNSEHGILCSNHERTVGHLMFPAVTPANVAQLTREQCEVQMASQGHDFVEIRKTGGKWQVVLDSHYNRRLTPWNADFRVGGPAGVARPGGARRNRCSRWRLGSPAAAGRTLRARWSGRLGNRQDRRVKISRRLPVDAGADVSGAAGRHGAWTPGPPPTPPSAPAPRSTSGRWSAAPTRRCTTTSGPRSPRWSSTGGAPWSSSARAGASPRST